MEENIGMEWKIFGMEWKKIASMEYRKIVFHSMPCILGSAYRYKIKSAFQ